MGVVPEEMFGVGWGVPEILSSALTLLYDPLFVFVLLGRYSHFKSDSAEMAFQLRLR